MMDCTDSVTAAMRGFERTSSPTSETFQRLLMRAIRPQRSFAGGAVSVSNRWNTCHSAVYRFERQLLDRSNANYRPDPDVCCLKAQRLISGHATPRVTKYNLTDAYLRVADGLDGNVLVTCRSLPNATR